VLIAGEKGGDDGDRQTVQVWSALLSGGLAAVEAACTEELGDGVHSTDVIPQHPGRRRDGETSADGDDPDL